MKRCPQCNQTYPDDDLNFCLDDGGQLVFVSNSSFEETVIRPSPFFQQPSPPVKQGVSPMFAYLAIGLLALVAGGAVVMWMKSDSSASSKNETPTTVSTPAEQKVSVSNEPQGNLKQEQEALEKERQKLADERQRLETKKNETFSTTTTRTSQPSSGTWFVVLGSYQKYESEKANQRLRYVQSLGYDATVVDTNNYPGFKGGLYSVVVGPYSKSDAKGLLGRMKSSISDAYIKSGW